MAGSKLIFSGEKDNTAARLLAHSLILPHYCYSLLINFLGNSTCRTKGRKLSLQLLFHINIWMQYCWGKESKFLNELCLTNLQVAAIKTTDARVPAKVINE